MSIPKTCAVIGGGPAGLMAAEVLSAGGCAVTVYDQMPSLGRKFLMAGVGGLNLTHAEGPEAFVARYRTGGFPLAEAIETFGPDDLRAWCEGLGEPTFVGSSGRVFPKSLKASPLLRAWLRRLEGAGVDVRTRHRWTGWEGDTLTFATPTGPATAQADAVILALGGASWPRLGSDGEWFNTVAEEGVEVTPLVPSNCGFHLDWAERVGDKFGGHPLKTIALSFGNRIVRGELMITRQGIEGGAVYALSSWLRDAIAAEGEAVAHVDLRPSLTLEAITSKLNAARSSDSTSNRLRKALRLSPAARAVLMHGFERLPKDAKELAHCIKAVPLRCLEATGLNRAISSGGGIAAAAVDARLMLTARPGVFVAGEMLDWEAPTGGYLLQGCFVTGRRAAIGALDWLSSAEA